MSKTYAGVELPDGSYAIEQLHTLYGSSETQLSYTYLDSQGVEIDVSKFKQDYWGKVDGVKPADFLPDFSIKGEEK